MSSLQGDRILFGGRLIRSRARPRRLERRRDRALSGARSRPCPGDVVFPFRDPSTGVRDPSCEHRSALALEAREPRAHGYKTYPRVRISTRPASFVQTKARTTASSDRRRRRCPAYSTARSSIFRLFLLWAPRRFFGLPPYLPPWINFTSTAPIVPLPPVMTRSPLLICGSSGDTSHSSSTRWSSSGSSSRLRLTNSRSARTRLRRPRRGPRSAPAARHPRASLLPHPHSPPSRSVRLRPTGAAEGASPAALRGGGWTRDLFRSTGTDFTDRTRQTRWRSGRRRTAASTCRCARERRISCRRLRDGCGGDHRQRVSPREATWLIIVDVAEARDVGCCRCRSGRSRRVRAAPLGN